MATRQRVRAEKNAQNADKRPRAIAKNLGVSPSKVRIVLNLIRGKDYAMALAILKNMPNVGAKEAVKVLEMYKAELEAAKALIAFERAYCTYIGAVSEDNLTALTAAAEAAEIEE